MERALIDGERVAEPIARHDVRGGGGLRLHVREWGDPQGPPIVFVHGWSQSQLCWSRQTAGPLAEDFRLVTFDLRGHGMSEKPPDAAAYVDARLWADDLDAVIEQLELDRPVVVAWSYGGYVITDYLAAYGEGAVAGVDLVGAAVLRTPGFEHIGPGLLENAGDACGGDLPASIAAILRFLRACTVRPLSDHDWSTALCWNMVVPTEVRAALFAREIDADEVLSRLSIPVPGGLGPVRPRARRARRSAPSISAMNMAERKSAKTGAQRATGKASKGFTEEERGAMKERARELKAGSRKAEGEHDVLEKIAEMPEPDRVMAERLHALVKATAPDLSPRTWYGMPAYAKGRDVICFFQSAQKFKSRYATLGFSDKANLDEGAMWPTSFALTELTAAEEARIRELVKQAVAEEGG